MFSKLGGQVTNCFHHIFFSKGSLYISALVFSLGLAENSVICNLISYFMQVNWENFNLTQAAAVVNVEQGLSAVMASIISCISEAYFCRFKVISCTTVLFIIGLLLLGVSTWLAPALEIRLFYPIVILTAISKAGNVLLRSFLGDQLIDHSKVNQAIDEEHLAARKNCWWRVFWSLGVVASCDLPVGSWRWNFLTSSTVMTVAYLWFLSGIKFYCHREPTESPLTNVFKVFKAAALKWHLAYPNTPNGYFKNDGDQLLLSPKVPFFRMAIGRWVDKASIIDSASQLTLDEQEIAGRLYTMGQVKQVKCLLTTFPIWTTLIICGVVESTARTFFIVQANNLDNKIGNHFIVPVTLFITLKSLVRFVVSFLLQSFIPNRLNRTKRQHIALVRIGLGMVFSVLTCIVAWQVEIHRLKVFKKETISIFWLAPQFILLGLMGGIAEEGLRVLFHNQVPESKELYESSSSSFFMDCALGIGNFLSIFLTFIFRQWFGDDINNSRLDKYYLMLAILNIGNLFYFCLVTIVFYIFWYEDEAREQDKVKLNLDGNLGFDGLADLVNNGSLLNHFSHYCNVLNKLV